MSMCSLDLHQKMSFSNTQRYVFISSMNIIILQYYSWFIFKYLQDKNTSLKLPVGVSPFQLVNLHRNQRYFVIKLHTWFCLSYFFKTNIKLHCIYQYFMSINSFFNTVSVHVTTHATHSDPWPTLARISSILLIWYINIQE